MWSPGMIKGSGPDSADTDEVLVDLNEWQVTRCAPARRKSDVYDVQVTYLPNRSTFSFNTAKTLTDSECIAVALSFFQNSWLTELMMSTALRSAR